MLEKRMEASLNEQINKEIYSAYLYMAMAGYSAELGLNGCKNWFNIQVKEELSHAEKFYNYVIEQGGRVVLDAIAAPPKDFGSIIGAFEETLKHEKNVTTSIKELVRIAREEVDVATEIFLQWFVSEQVEEEATVSDILQKLKLVGDSGGGLFMLDNELGKRVFVAPTV